MKVLISLLTLISFTAFAQDNEDLISIELIETGNQIKSRITSLGSAGVDAGFDEINLIGSLKKIQTPNGEQVSLTWAAAELNGDASAIADPFESTLILQEGLRAGMEFKAKGDKTALLEAMRALANRAGEEEKLLEDQESNEVVQRGHSGLSGGTSTENPDIDTGSPAFVAEDEPFIFVTSDGCDMLIDEAQGVAIVQERTLVDGEEQSGCAESLTRYPLTRIYADCPLLEKLEELTVYEQFTLGYTDPTSGGRIEVRGCTQDNDRTITMVSTPGDCPILITETEAKVQGKISYFKDGIEHTVSSCAATDVSYPLETNNADCQIRHDFDGGQSYQQVRKAYNDGTDLVIVPSSLCEDDTNQAYAHITTKDTCSPTVENNTVIFNFRKFISVNGEITYITECTPDTSQNTAVLSENCTTSPYEHDFNTGQSYRKKNYYYMDGSTRVDVLTCQASEETFTHYKDIGECQLSNDDTTRLTQYYAKTFITDDNEVTGTKTFITDCQQNGDPVSYTTAGNIWQKSFSTVKFLNVGGSLNITSNGSSSPLVNNHGWSKVSDYDCNSTVGMCIQRSVYTGNSIVISNAACATQNLNSVSWVTTEGVTLDKSYSDASPSISFNASTVSFLNQHCSPPSYLSLNTSYTYTCAMPSTHRFADAWFKSISRLTNLTCSTPSCNVTTLQKHPVYRRGDNSEYIHTSVVNGTKHVCGTGNSLNGTRE